MSDLFIIDDQKEQYPNTEKEFYTIKGKQEFFNKDKNPCVKLEENALAKKTKTNDRTKFFIKVGLYGRPYNPIGMYSEGYNKKFLSKAGKSEYSFKEVNEKTFSFYLKFLTTKNTAWLNYTERELQ